jgi:hypothetical protein
MPNGAMLPQNGGDETVLSAFVDAVSSPLGQDWKSTPPPEQDGRPLFSDSPPDRAERFEPRPEYQ